MNQLDDLFVFFIGVVVGATLLIVMSFRTADPDLVRSGVFAICMVWLVTLVAVGLAKYDDK